MHNADQTSPTHDQNDEVFGALASSLTNRGLDGDAIVEARRDWITTAISEGASIPEIVHFVYDRHTGEDSDVERLRGMSGNGIVADTRPHRIASLRPENWVQ